jgi:hypothetical protein
MDAPDVTFSPRSTGWKAPKVRCSPTSRGLRLRHRHQYRQRRPTRSRHLTLPCTDGPVVSDKGGTWIYYCVLPERLAQMSDAVQLTDTA